ncbi:hypothetical protein AGMMS50267_02010 [Spirochaetia bacterium]|nr:hypothetical protein AGMMS50267_02010 [Spirochaetia bacterium]
MDGHISTDPDERTNRAEEFADQLINDYGYDFTQPVLLLTRRGGTEAHNDFASKLAQALQRRAGAGQEAYVFAPGDTLWLNSSGQITGIAPIKDGYDSVTGTWTQTMSKSTDGVWNVYNVYNGGKDPVYFLPYYNMGTYIEPGRFEVPLMQLFFGKYAKGYVETYRYNFKGDKGH